MILNIGVQDRTPVIGLSSLFSSSLGLWNTSTRRQGRHSYEHPDAPFLCADILASFLSELVARARPNIAYKSRTTFQWHSFARSTPRVDRPRFDVDCECLRPALS